MSLKQLTVLKQTEVPLLNALCLIVLHWSPKNIWFFAKSKKPVETAGAWELRKLLAFNCWHDIHKVVCDLENSIYFL